MPRLAQGQASERSRERMVTQRFTSNPLTSERHRFVEYTPPTAIPVHSRATSHCRCLTWGSASSDVYEAHALASVSSNSLLVCG